MSDLDAKELALWDAQINPDANGKMPTHVFQAITDKIVKDRADTTIALEKERKQVVKPVDYESKIITFQNALDALLDENASADVQNQLLKECIERMTYSRGLAERIPGGRHNWSYEPIDLDTKLKV